VCVSEKPEVPSEFKIVEVSSNSIQLTWMCGANGGENATYVININDIYNLTTIIDEEPANSNENFDSSAENIIEIENRLKLIELRGESHSLSLSLSLLLKFKINKKQTNQQTLSTILLFFFLNN
jgi:hypothetical protein